MTEDFEMNRYERGKQLGHDWKAMDKPNWYRCNSCGREVEITFYIDDPHSIAAEMNLPVCSHKLDRNSELEALGMMEDMSMSNRDDQIAGLLSESVLTNKLLQRVIYAFQTTNLEKVEPAMLPEDKIGKMIRFFKSAQEDLNNILDRLAYIRIGFDAKEQEDNDALRISRVSIRSKNA